MIDAPRQCSMRQKGIQCPNEAVYEVTNWLSDKGTTLRPNPESWHPGICEQHFAEPALFRSPAYKFNGLTRAEMADAAVPA